MTPALVAWLLIPLLTVFTLRNLPFINMDLAVRLQLWALDLLRKLDEWEDEDRRPKP